MTTSISSEAHENMNKSMIKRRKNLVGKKNKKTFILYSLIFSHCSMPERPTDKVNYIIDALLAHFSCYNHISYRMEDGRRASQSESKSSFVIKKENIIWYLLGVMFAFCD